MGVELPAEPDPVEQPALSSQIALIQFALYFPSSEPSQFLERSCKSLIAITDVHKGSGAVEALKGST